MDQKFKDEWNKSYNEFISKSIIGAVVSIAAAGVMMADISSKVDEAKNGDLYERTCNEAGQNALSAHVEGNAQSLNEKLHKEGWRVKEHDAVDIDGVPSMRTDYTYASSYEGREKLPPPFESFVSSVNQACNFQISRPLDAPREDKKFALNFAP